MGPHRLLGGRLSLRLGGSSDVEGGGRRGPEPGSVAYHSSGLEIVWKREYIREYTVTGSPPG